MPVLLNFITEELRNVARLRNVDGYENMSRQQQKNIFTTQSASIPTPIPINETRCRPRSKPRHQKFEIEIRIPPTPRPRCTPEPLKN